jgi:hypothetical protein
LPKSICALVHLIRIYNFRDLDEQGRRQMLKMPLKLKQNNTIKPLVRISTSEPNSRGSLHSQICLEICRSLHFHH